MATANDYINYTLQAGTKSVPRYQGDLSTVVDVVDPGSIVGTIYSWVTRNGVTYWELYESYAPGSPMYVKHDADLIPINPSGTIVQVTSPGFFTDLSNSSLGTLTKYAGYALLAWLGGEAIKLFKK